MDGGHTRVIARGGRLDLDLALQHELAAQLASLNPLGRRGEENVDDRPRPGDHVGGAVPFFDGEIREVVLDVLVLCLEVNVDNADDAGASGLEKRQHRGHCSEGERRYRG